MSPINLFQIFFLVAKPSSKFRPVINLRQLNKFVAYEYFKLETFSFVLQIIQNDFFHDMEKAYFSIAIHDQDCKFF